MAEYFIEKQKYGSRERMNPNMPGGVPQALEGVIEQQFDPGRWKRKVQAQDMKGVTAYMRKGLLRAENIWYTDTTRTDTTQTGHNPDRHNP